MSIIRVNNKKDNYSIISNKVINDNNLSWKAKGLLVYLLSKPNNWQVYVSHLTKMSKDGRDSTSNGIKELIEKGYMKRKEKRNSQGHFGGYDYEVFEDVVENPITGNPISGNPISENTELVNTDNKQELNKVNTDPIEKPKTVSSDLKLLIDFFYKAYQEAKGINYKYSGAKDTKLLKAILETFGLDECKRYIKHYFSLNDAFLLKTGHTVGMLHSRVNAIAAECADPFIKKAQKDQMKSVENTENLEEIEL